jgi:hypothetical protein
VVVLGLVPSREWEKSKSFYWKHWFYRLGSRYPLIYLVQYIYIGKKLSQRITTVLNILYMLQMLLLETSSTVLEILGVLKQLQLTLISKKNYLSSNSRGKYYLTTPADVNLRQWATHTLGTCISYVLFVQIDLNGPNRFLMSRNCVQKLPNTTVDDISELN